MHKLIGFQISENGFVVLREKFRSKSATKIVSLDWEEAWQLTQQGATLFLFTEQGQTQKLFKVVCSAQHAEEINKVCQSIGVTKFQENSTEILLPLELIELVDGILNDSAEKHAKQYTVNLPEESLTNFDFCFDSTTKKADEVQALLNPYYTLKQNTSVTKQSDFSIYSCTDTLQKVIRVYNESSQIYWFSSQRAVTLKSFGRGFEFFQWPNHVMVGKYRYQDMADSHTLYFLKTPHSNWKIYLDPRSADEVVNIMRIIRSFASYHLINNGAIPVHASAFVTHQKDAHIICGPKFAGKTTNLIRALLNIETAQFLSNDRIYLVPYLDGYRVLGSPHSVPIRKNTLELFPPFLNEMLNAKSLGGARGYNQRIRAKSKGKSEVVIEGGNNQEIYLSPTELAEHCGSSIQNNGILKHIFLPTGNAEANFDTQKTESDLDSGDIIKTNIPFYIDSAWQFWNDLLDCFPTQIFAEKKLKNIATIQMAFREPIENAWKSQNKTT